MNFTKPYTEIANSDLEELINAVHTILEVTWDFDEKAVVAPSNGVRLRLRDAILKVDNRSRRD